MQGAGASQVSSLKDLTGFQVVHAVRGRTRLRVESPELLATLAQTIESFFAEHPGLHEMRVNPDCLSVVLIYDPDAVHIEVPVSADDTPRTPFSWAGSALEALARPRDAAGDLATTALLTARDLLARTAVRWNRSAPGWLALPRAMTDGRPGSSE